MSINWSLLSPSQFEELCYRILEIYDFTQIQWFGKHGSDKGRDITARKVEKPIPSIQVEKRWIVQCKRYIEKPPGINEISYFLNCCREHKPDKALLILTNTLTSGTKDWLEKIKDEYSFEIFIWEENELEKIIEDNKKTLQKFFPQIYTSGGLIEFYTVDTGEYHIKCKEIDEVILVAFNCNNYQEAKEKVKEFLEFVKNNDFEIEDN